VSVLRRAWRVLTDPPASEAARLLRFLIPLETAFVSLRFLPGWDFSWPHTTLMDVLWLYVVLYFVRQRDEARARPHEGDEVLQTTRPDRPAGW